MLIYDSSFCSIVSALVSMFELRNLFCPYLYRDMKPENVMIALDGHVKLIDFGLSKDRFYGVNKGTYCGTKGINSTVFSEPSRIRDLGTRLSYGMQCWFRDPGSEMVLRTPLN